MTDHTQILLDTTRTLTERTAEYGSPAEAFQRAATIASTVLGKSLTAYDIVMIMNAVKLSRLPTSRDKVDNYADAINYLAFAAEFITEQSPHQTLRVIKKTMTFGTPAVDLDQMAKDVAGE